MKQWRIRVRIVEVREAVIIAVDKEHAIQRLYGRSWERLEPADEAYTKITRVPGPVVCDGEVADSAIQ